MKRFSRLTLLLVACLLLGQLAQLAHAHDFASHYDGSTCYICLSSNTQDHESSCPDYGTSMMLTHELTLDPVIARQGLPTHFRYLSRAPPQ
ncbi:MAG: hypothetical protein WBN95_12295 [Gammaproteobacteria bacterium]